MEIGKGYALIFEWAEGEQIGYNDFYAKQSYMNGMGGIFGVKTLMSP